jgi:spore coat protein U-like protein
MRFVLTLLIYLFPVLASAGKVTGILEIRATVVASCSVATQPLTLAAHPNGSTQTTGTANPGSIDLRCTRGTPVTVAIDQGPLTGPGGATLAYALNAPTSAMGQGAQVVSLPVTGTIGGGQDVPIGDYAGTALVRVTY